MLYVLLLYALHICAWFILGAIASIIQGREGTLTWKSAMALGFVSFAAQEIYLYIH